MTHRTRTAIYVTRDGQVVTEGHPDVHVMLYPAGAEITEAEAQRHGLHSIPGALETRMGSGAKAVSGPPETKAVSFPPETRRSKKR